MRRPRMMAGAHESPIPAERIALFLPFLGGRGANRVMLNLANGFAAAGKAVDLVLAEAKGELLSAVSPGVRIVDLKSAGGVLKSLPAYSRYLRREKPTILLTAMDYVNVLSVLIRAISSPNTRLYVSCHTALRDSASGAPRLWDRLLPVIVRWAYRFAEGVVAVSHAGADDLRSTLGSAQTRIVTIYNPVVDSQFEERAAEPLRHPWFDPGQPPVVVAVGALDPRKDYGTLLDAFAMLRKRKPARLLIIGEGEERATMEKRIAQLELSDSVALPGFVSNPLPYVKAAALFVLSSRTEGFGLVLAEALACGTPVVSTDCKFGPREILNGGAHGRLVPVGDAATLASAMEMTLEEAPDRTALRARGNHFSLKRSVEEYLRLFDLSAEIGAPVGI